MVLKVCARGKRTRKKREKERNARVAQLVERDLAKVEAAGSSPVSRSFNFTGSLENRGLPYFYALIKFDYTF